MKMCARALLLAIGLFAATGHADTVKEPVAVCVDRYLSKLKPPTVDIETVTKYGSACADLVRAQNASDLSTASNEVLINQRYNTNVLLWMVVLITISGIVLAGMQLFWGYQLALVGKGQMSGDNDLNISNNNLAVRSSFVGVIVLAISLAFFIVFVGKVYTINLLGSNGDETDGQQTGNIVDQGAGHPLSASAPTAAASSSAQPQTK